MLRLTALAALAPLPAMAATGPFFSLQNTNFVVLLAFIVFVGILIYFQVPAKLMGMLDKRSDGIRSELEDRIEQEVATAEEALSPDLLSSAGITGLREEARRIAWRNA